MIVLIWLMMFSYVGSILLLLLAEEKLNFTILYPAGEENL